MVNVGEKYEWYGYLPEKRVKPLSDSTETHIF